MSWYALLWYMLHCKNHQSIDVNNDVTTWKRSLHYCPFVRGIHRSPVDSLRKEAVMQSLDVPSVRLHGKICRTNSRIVWDIVALMLCHSNDMINLIDITWGNFYFLLGQSFHVFDCCRGMWSCAIDMLPDKCLFRLCCRNDYLRWLTQLASYTYNFSPAIQIGLDI